MPTQVILSVFRAVRHVILKLEAIKPNQFGLFPWMNPQYQNVPQLAGVQAGLSQQEDHPSMFDGFLLAAPKKRRTLERRRLRSFGFLKHMVHARTKDNIVMCPKCNNWHESYTICGHCYDKVRKKTADIQGKLFRNDDFLYNQTDDDVHTLEKKIKSHEPDPLEWWNENLKTKVK